ncbi:hypothetical protein, partial [Klebsiella pneumoniae]
LMAQDSLPLPLYSAFFLYFLTSPHFCSIKNLASRTQEDGRLTSQNNHLVEAQMPGSFMDQRWREVKKQRKKTI